MLTKFRNLYPQGSILSELIDIDRGTYIVRVSIQVGSLTLATGLAGEDSVEKAEDSARNRALQTLTLEDGHLSLNLAARADSEVRTSSQTTSSPKASVPLTAAPPEISSSNHHHDSESPERFPPSKRTNASATVISQPHIATQTEIATTIVPPPITNPPVPTALPLEPAVETKNVPEPEPEPEPILSAPEPESIVSYAPELIESNLEPPVELVPTEEAYAPEKPAIPEAPAEFDFNQIRHKIDLEMKRLSWTKEQGRDYLLSTYGKRSRLHLTDDELLEFWHYLETLPN